MKLKMIINKNPAIKIGMPIIAPIAVFENIMPKDIIYLIII